MEPTRNLHLHLFSPTTWNELKEKHGHRLARFSIGGMRGTSKDLKIGSVILLVVRRGTNDYILKGIVEVTGLPYKDYGYKMHQDYRLNHTLVPVKWLMSMRGNLHQDLFEYGYSPKEWCAFVQRYFNMQSGRFPAVKNQQDLDAMYDLYFKNL